jgi:hypothetical protein
MKFDSRYSSRQIRSYGQSGDRTDQEQNRLETATPTVAGLTLAHLEYLKEQQNKL